MASEPHIFWKGENAQQIIDGIHMPEALGKLIPADKRFNVPSGMALDELFLKPLGYTREEAWLCDLLPYSRINANQQKAIEKHYNPLLKEFDLPECTIPKFSEAELKNHERVNEIIYELEQSKAREIVLLGDQPIRHFLSHFSDYKRLSDFGSTEGKYGKEHSLITNGKPYQVIPLVHPRQAAALGRSSKEWKKLHDHWILGRKE